LDESYKLTNAGYAVYTVDVHRSYPTIAKTTYHKKAVFTKCVAVNYELQCDRSAFKIHLLQHNYFTQTIGLGSNPGRIIPKT